jgi:hypothetical protein
LRSLPKVVWDEVKKVYSTGLGVQLDLTLTNFNRFNSPFENLAKVPATLGCRLDDMPGLFVNLMVRVPQQGVGEAGF